MLGGVTRLLRIMALVAPKADARAEVTIAACACRFLGSVVDIDRQKTRVRESERVRGGLAGASLLTFVSDD